MLVVRLPSRLERSQRKATVGFQSEREKKNRRVQPHAETIFTRSVSRVDVGDILYQVFLTCSQVLTDDLSAYF